MQTNALSFETGTIAHLLRCAPDQFGQPFDESRAWSALFESEIGAYVTDLEATYRDTQASGLYGPSFSQDFPHFASWVDRLRGERRSILTSLRIVLDDLHEPTTRTSLATSLRTLTDRIQGHDHDENDLLQQAYTVDMGAGG